MKVTQRNRGFTLVELMIAVCIVGVLASVALPAYSRFMNEARAGEGVASLGALYKGAVAYWNKPISSRGLGETEASHCVTFIPGGSPPILPPFPPGPEKRTADFATDATFAALGFTRADPGYFSLMPGGAVGVAGALPTPCGSTDGLAYGFFAMCDLNGDGLIGGYGLTAFARGGVLQRGLGVRDVGDLYDETQGVACPICAPGIN